ncbi:MAG TPA: tetratricopeptide repeat protein, partial [Tepidisphaeraceae bacterium]|nr:tetratricopeptide repeat protein [Tepidisphaeraceae bacterium]
MVLDARGRSADAIPLVDEALRLIALGKTRDGYDPQALGNRLQEAEALNLRVVLLNSAGLKQEADVAAAALPEQLAALLGRDHFYTAAAAATRAQVLLDLQRPNEALPLLESAVPVFERELGPEHRDTLVVLGNQISALGGSGRIAQAAGQAETLLARTEKVLGSRHFDTLLMRHRVAVMHYKARQPDRALPFATSAVEGMLALAGERNWLAGQFFVPRALIQNQRHEIDAALADVRRGLLIYDRTPPPDPSRVET